MSYDPKDRPLHHPAGDRGQHKPRTAQVKLRAPWLYGERSNTPEPGRVGLVDATQIRAMKRAVRTARAEGKLHPGQAKEELAELDKGADIIRKGPLRDVGVYFPAGECWQPVKSPKGERRKKSKAAKQARKANRSKKKRR